MTKALQPATEILLQIGDYTVTLRASLRAAVALEAYTGGIAALWTDIACQRLSALHYAIRAGAVYLRDAEAVLKVSSTMPLQQVIGPAQAACLALLTGILAPAQSEAQPSDKPASDPIPLSKFFTELFSLATSWLCWPPSEVWNASVAEIVTALEAKADRELRQAGVRPADTQTNEAQRQANIDAGLDPDFDRAGLQRLKAKT